MKTTFLPIKSVYPPQQFGQLDRTFDVVFNEQKLKQAISNQNYIPNRMITQKISIYEYSKRYSRQNFDISKFIECSPPKSIKLKNDMNIFEPQNKVKYFIRKPIDLKTIQRVCPICEEIWTTNNYNLIRYCPICRLQVQRREKNKIKNCKRMLRRYETNV